MFSLCVLSVFSSSPDKMGGTHSVRESGWVFVLPRLFVVPLLASHCLWHLNTTILIMCVRVCVRMCMCVRFFSSHRAANRAWTYRHTHTHTNTCTHSHTRPYARTHAIALAVVYFQKGLFLKGKLLRSMCTACIPNKKIELLICSVEMLAICVRQNVPGKNETNGMSQRQWWSCG